MLHKSVSKYQGRDGGYIFPHCQHYRRLLPLLHRLLLQHPQAKEHQLLNRRPISISRYEGKSSTNLIYFEKIFQAVHDQEAVSMNLKSCKYVNNKLNLSL